MTSYHEQISQTISDFNNAMASEEKALSPQYENSSEGEDDLEVNLSCGSSSFGDEDERSDLQDSDPDETDREVEQVAGAMAGINPYQFEPYASDTDIDGNDDDDENREQDRLEDNAW